MKTILFTLFMCFGLLCYSQPKFNITSVDVSRQAGETNPVYQAYQAFYSNEMATLNAQIGSIQRQMLTAGISKSQLDVYKKQIDELQVKLKELQAKSDDLQDMENFKHKKFHFLDFGSNNSNAFFNIMYSQNSNKLKALSSSGFAVGDHSGSVYTELVSGNFKTLRLSFGTMISNSAAETELEETSEEAFQRLATNGGNTSLTVEYPLLYWGEDDNQYNMIGRFMGRAAADFEAFGTKTADFAGSLSGGFDLYGDFSTNNREIRLYGNVNWNMIYGTETYRDNLGIKAKQFTFAKITAGFIVQDKLNVSLIFNTFSSEESLQNRNVIVSASIML